MSSTQPQGSRATAWSMLVRERGRWRRVAIEGRVMFGGGADSDVRLVGVDGDAAIRLRPDGDAIVAIGRGDARCDGLGRLDARPRRLPAGSVLRIGGAALVLFAEVEPASERRPGRVLLRAGDGVSGAASVWQAWAELMLAARAPWPVLLTGESGTGKELAARSLHASSPRRDRPFVAISAASLPRETLHAELFGAKRGAYTGSVADREGAFGQADGGTLLLDEVGELDDGAQAALLRALESAEITPLGGSPRKVDVRLVAATHRDLEAMVAQGRFRLDLYHRLAIAEVELPPLPQRDEDAADLLELWLQQPLPARARDLLVAHAWPGNLRELRNVARRLEIALDGAPCGADEVHAAITSSRRFGRRDGPVAARTSGRSAMPGGNHPSVAQVASAASIPARDRLSRMEAVQAAMAQPHDGVAAWRRSGLPRATYFRLARDLREPAFS